MSPLILRDELLCSGRRVKLYRRLVSIDGRLVERDLVSFGKAVVIVPILDDGRVLFVRQWRAAIGDWVLELPAGRVEEGEGVEKAAIRELEEETGFTASTLEPIATAYVSPGYSDEVQTLVVAKGLRFVGARPEVGEVLSVVPMHPQEYLQVARKSVADLKSLAAVLLYMAFKGPGPCEVVL